MRRIIPLVVLLACADPLGWLYRTEPEPFDPPPEYQTYWAQAEHCTGLTGNFARLRFHVSDSLPCPGHLMGCYGFWVQPHDIYLLRRVTGRASVVRHEMTHDLLQRDGHPPAYFPRCEDAT